MARDRHFSLVNDCVVTSEGITQGRRRQNTKYLRPEEKHSIVSFVKFTLSLHDLKLEATMESENSSDSQAKDDRLFFTTSDLLNQINSVVDREHEQSNDGSGPHPRFELQRRFEDGTTRKASAEEAAAADFQSKVKQVCDISSADDYALT